MGTWVSVLLILVVFALLLYVIWDTKMELRSSEEQREERFKVIVKSILTAYVKQEYCDANIKKTDAAVSDIGNQVKEFISLCKACSKSKIETDKG